MQTHLAVVKRLQATCCDPESKSTQSYRGVVFLKQTNFSHDVHLLLTYLACLLRCKLLEAQLSNYDVFKVDKALEIVSELFSLAADGLQDFLVALPESTRSRTQHLQHANGFLKRETE
jgi:hypothetical protein